MPGSPEFMVAYQAAVASDTAVAGTANRRPAYQASPVGSFGHACLAYYASAEFRSLDEKTQHWRRACLDKVCEKIGRHPITLIQAKHVRALRAELAATPAAADQRLRALKALFRFAIENELAATNPTRDIKAVRTTEGHHSWLVEEIEQYKARHPIGSMARLAIMLLYYTSCRREDVIRFGHQHVKDGRLRYTQAKNEHKSPNHMDIEVQAELASVIAATPSGHLTFLTSVTGRPFSVGTFGKAFRKWCDEAGLPQRCTAHGLRYAFTGALIDAGCTPHETMAITGHRSLAMVEKYAKGRNKRHLADSAMAKLRRSNGERK